MTDTERAYVRLMTQLLISYAVRQQEQRQPAIHPTMRPDPQAAIATHGTLMSHARA